MAMAAWSHTHERRGGGYEREIEDQGQELRKLRQIVCVCVYCYVVCFKGQAVKSLSDCEMAEEKCTYSRKVVDEKK